MCEKSDLLLYHLFQFGDIFIMQLYNQNKIFLHYCYILDMLLYCILVFIVHVFICTIHCFVDFKKTIVVNGCLF